MNENGVFGEIKTLSGEHLFVTLEHVYSFGPKIQDGEYKCVLGTHRLLHGLDFQTYEITGIVGHSKVLFHYGNFNKDSDGCVLIGKEIQGIMITDSRESFSRFMQIQNGLNEFSLIVTTVD